jgi:hypothetical protein
MLQHGLVALGTQPDGTNPAFGLVPNGKANVAATLSTGAEESLAVTTNIVVAARVQGPETRTFLNADGAPVAFSDPPYPHHLTGSGDSRRQPPEDSHDRTI